MSMKQCLLCGRFVSDRIVSTIFATHLYARISSMALANLTSAIKATMCAVLWEGNAYNVTVADVPRPSIINATDAIVKLSRAAICGSDLHISRGTNPGPATPWILGHEGIGNISEVGEGVGSLAVGDPVIIPFATAEGHIHASLTTRMYGGYGNGGGMGGTQGQLRLTKTIREAH